MVLASDGLASVGGYPGADDKGKDYTAYIYPGVNHGFHNDTTPRFDAEAAKFAEDRTVAFFKEHLM